jgi:hypothetical protein
MQLIGQEIGLNGGDSVQFLDELEDRFGVSLEPLVQGKIIRDPPSSIRRLLELPGRQISDFTVAELVDYLVTTVGFTPKT